MKTNADQLVSLAVMGQIAAPSFEPLPAMPYALSADGESYLLPAYGGLVYNVSIGDSAYGWLGDSIHPSVSVQVKDESGNRGLNILACIGNTAVAMSSGAQGVVTGKSGLDQVIIHFGQEDRRKMGIGDKIVIRAKGVGLELTDYPGVTLKNCSPELIDGMELMTLPNGKLGVPVVAVVPPYLVGAGAGLNSEGGSLHIQSADRMTLKEVGLNQLRLGDVVALADYDSMWGYGYRRGSVSIGVIGQGDSPRAGYGPGVTVIITSTNGDIEPVIAFSVNLRDMLALR
jgi:hypothetical protein